jgi:hypothetical protein
MDEPIDPGIGDISPVFLLVGAVVGTAMGFACGKIPMAYATERRRDGLGLAAMVSCVLSGFLLGCLLAMPVAMIWTLIIICVGPAADGRPDRRQVYKTWVPPVSATGAALPGPYSRIGPVVVCNECQHAHKPGPEGVPEACPACGYDFRTKAAEIPVVESAAGSELAEPTRPEPRRKLVSWREERRRGNLPRGERALSARQRVALARGEADPPPPASESGEVIELQPPSDDPRGW